MVGPCWLGEIDWGISELLEEVGNNLKCASAREGLGSDNASAVELWVVEAECYSSCSGVELSDSFNWSIFLIKSRIVNDLLLDFLDDREHKWLSIVVSVGSNTQIDLLWVCVILEVGGQGEDWISWGLLNVDEVVNSELGSSWLEVLINDGKLVHDRASLVL